MIAYHFTSDRLRDGRPVPAVGETLTHEGEIVWGKSGLYASRKPHHALKCAPGALLHMVECDRIELEDDDKFVCRSRTIIVSIDATYLLRRFAADQALSVAHMWDMPDVVREYLTTLDETKRAAARNAAWAAARNAAWAAAWDAARDAARDAAWDAARDAAWDAAARAAWAEARAAAWDAARGAAWDAAWGAAWDAARDAARDAAMTDFNARVEHAFAETNQ